LGISSAQVTFEYKIIFSIIESGSEWTGDGTHFTAQTYGVIYYHGSVFIFADGPHWAYCHTGRYTALLADCRKRKTVFFKSYYRYARMQRIELSRMGKRTNQFATAAARTLFGFNKKNFAHTFLISPCSGKPVLTLLFAKFEKPICVFQQWHNANKY